MGSLLPLGAARSYRSGLLLPERPALWCVSPGGVSELADEHDLGSCGAIRESSSLSFPTVRGRMTSHPLRAEVAQR